jgi:hypothetical protein
MRCTKCGFISFDFNQVCPRCNRELRDEQRKLNLPFFRPDPPQLLSRLMGEAAYADEDIHTEPMTFEDLPFHSEHEAGLDASFSGMEDDISLNEEDHEVLSLEPEKIEPAPSLNETQLEDFRLDMEDISLSEPESPSEARTGDEEDLLDLVIEDDLFAIQTEETSAVIEKPQKELTEKDVLEAEASFSLDDLSFDDLELEGHEISDSVAEIHKMDQPADTTLPESKILEGLFQEDNPEGLTREIDMKKFKKDLENFSRKNQ